MNKKKLLRVLVINTILISIVVSLTYEPRAKEDEQVKLSTSIRTVQKINSPLKILSSRMVYASNRVEYLVMDEGLLSENEKVDIIYKNKVATKICRTNKQCFQIVRSFNPYSETPFDLETQYL